MNFLKWATAYLAGAHALQSNNTQASNELSCEPGWTGPTCKQLSPALPGIGKICSPEHSTWGGSILQGVDDTEYAITSTMVDDNGLTCWPSTSTPGIWRRVGKGPWEFLSFVGLNGMVLWGHNCYAVIETKLADPTDPTSIISARITIFSLEQIDKKTRTVVRANFANPIPKNLCQPNRWAKQFPVANKEQQMVVHYSKEFPATSEAAIRAQVTEILESRVLIKNINGYNRDVYVNQEFSLSELKRNNPWLRVNSVNPAPLIDIHNNYMAIFKNPANPVDPNYYKAVFYRTSAVIGGKAREVIASMYMLANKYSSESGVFTPGASDNCTWNIEDPYCWVTQNGKFRCIVHAGGNTCPGDWNACTGVMEVPDTFFNRKSYCNPPVMIANKFVDNETLVDYGQRPALFQYKADKSGKKCIAFTRGVVPDQPGPRKSCTYVQVIC